MKIKNYIKKVIFKLLPIKKIIFFESVPNVSDNSKAVFDEMVKMGLNKKYKMVWRVDGEYIPKTIIKNVEYINCKTKSGARKLKYYSLVSKCLISCNSTIGTMKKGQYSIFLSHGTNLKRTRDYYTIPNNIDNFVVSGEGVKQMMSYQLKYDVNKMVALGFPRNDVLTQPAKPIKHLFNVDYDKVIVWYPTYRQHRNGSTTGVENPLPTIHNQETAIKLNSHAKKSNILIVLKPHFVQDVSYVKDLNLSNIIFINDEFFVKNEISSYEFIASCDALITDYSSIYYDYTLCDKPIGVIWEDINEYRNKPGLIDEFDDWMIGAEKLYTIDDFCDFIDRVKRGQDLLRNERNKIRDIACVSVKGDNSKRVVDFILDKIE